MTGRGGAAERHRSPGSCRTSSLSLSLSSSSRPRPVPLASDSRPNISGLTNVRVAGSSATVITFPMSPRPLFRLPAPLRTLLLEPVGLHAGNYTKVLRQATNYSSTRAHAVGVVRCDCRGPRARGAVKAEWGILTPFE